MANTHPPAQTTMAIPRKRPAETQEEAWVADEDRFVLRQATKKALLRVRSQRAQPIDDLAVILRSLDRERSGFESDDEDTSSALVAVNPEVVFDGLNSDNLLELEKGIDTYLALEKVKSNRDFWHVMKTICKDRRELGVETQSSARGLSSVAHELDKLLEPKTLTQLEALEKQVHAKLRSDESIDVDYWENLLKRLKVHKARQELHLVSGKLIDARRDVLVKQQLEEGARLRHDTETTLKTNASLSSSGRGRIDAAVLDPQPLLKLPKEFASFAAEDTDTFERKLRDARNSVTRARFIDAPSTISGDNITETDAVQNRNGRSKPAGDGGAYEREVARGVAEDEEIFATEEQLTSTSSPAWAGTYIPRKPQHFNRVQTGYEWNKYNQTHYDHENPPPKVVQGYKFNLFYPDLIEKTKAPTYRIERENGRKRGTLSAPAGEEDTCLIRFIAGPPYEDIAFRIVDKEWDYSAKHERGFKSRFDKGILQLHFQFKKIYYRK